MKERVYIIVLNWNGTEDTVDCLKSLKTHTYENYVVVLVDNGSEKDNLTTLKIWCSDNYDTVTYYTREQAENGGVVHYEEILEKVDSVNKLVFIENIENLGFAAGNNVALRYALKRGANYTMLLNNDTVIEKESVSILMQFLISNCEFVAATPQIRYYEPNNRVWNCGGKLTWYGNRKYYYAGDNITKIPQIGFKRISFITGCALLFKPELTGILTEKFFFGEEDMDFSFRQKREKRKIACCFSSVIYHKVSASFRKVDSNIIGTLYIYYLSRLINNKQYSSSFMFIIKIIMNLGYAVQLMLFRYKIKPKQIYIMISTLLKELWRLEVIDRDYCMRSFKEEFKYPVTWI